MYVLGLYSDGDYFKVSLISKKGKNSRIEFLKEFKKDTTNLKALKKILDKKRSFFSGQVQVVSALNQEEIFIKNFFIPFTSARKVKKALDFEMSTDEIYTDENRFFTPVFEKLEKETKVTLYGFTKQAMEKHLEDVGSLGINPEWVSSVSKGLERFVHFFAKNVEPFFLFHLGWETSFFYYIEKEEIKREVTISLGLKKIIDAIQKDKVVNEPVDIKKIADLFIEAIELNKKSNGAAVFYDLEREISRGWSYILEEEAKASDVQKILFTGYLEFSESLKPYLPPIDFETLVITPHLEFSSFQINTYAIEIGLALDRAVSDKKSIQLAVEQFIPKAQKKRGKEYLYKYFGIYLTSICMLFFISGLFFMEKKGALKNKYEKIIEEISLFNEPLAKKIYFKEELLKKNRKTLEEGIKKQKEMQRIALGPKTLVPFMEWILFCKSKGLDVELSEYRVEEKPREEDPCLDYITKVKLTINHSKGKDTIELFKQSLPSFKLFNKIYEKIEYSEDFDTTLVTFKVKT